MMHRHAWVTPSERRFMSSRRRTPSGSNDPASTMSAPHPDTDTDGPTIHAVKHEGRWVLAEEDGDAGAWVAAESTVRIDYVR